MLGNLIGGFIVILVGVNLIPTVAQSVYSAQTGCTDHTTCANITGSSATLLGLTTIFYAIGIMASGVSLAVGGLRNAGVV